MQYTKGMQSTLLTIRAIGAEYAKRLWLPVMIITLITTVALIALVWWLMQSASGWWVLAGIPVVLAGSVGIGVLWVTRLTINYVSPVKTDAQKHAVKTFVDDLEAVSEAAFLPKIHILFRVVRDIAAPRENGYVQTLTGANSRLQAGFKDIQKLFR